MTEPARPPLDVGKARSMLIKIVASIVVQRELSGRSRGDGEGSGWRPSPSPGPPNYEQPGFRMIGPSSVAKNQADGDPNCAVPPKELPFVIWPNSHRHVPPTLASVQCG